MKVLQVHNMISPHQMPVAKRLREQVGHDNFRFAAIGAPSVERRRMGWHFEADHEWILDLSRSSRDRHEFEAWWDSADIVLTGERILPLIRRRTRHGKLTAYTNERWWKPPLGRLRLLHPRILASVLAFRTCAKTGKFFFLANGKAAAEDLAGVAGLQRVTRKWGYFVEPPADFELTSDKHKSTTILYAGRMLSWKRVDTLVLAFREVLTKVPDAKLILVGDGTTRKSIISLVDRVGLAGSVEMVPHEAMHNVWNRMNKCSIFVLPSNSAEGWGVVVNEAMSRGCVVVAGRTTGAASFLINHGKNGYTYTSGDSAALAAIIISFSSNPYIKDLIAKNAIASARELWSPETAAKRFLDVFSANIDKKMEPQYEDGPMSRIGIVR